MKIDTIFCKGLNLALTIDKVEKNDVPQYVLCAESWCTMFQDVVGFAPAYQLASAITNRGLYECIRAADQYAANYLSLSIDDASAWSESSDLSLKRLWDEVVIICARDSSSVERYILTDESSRFTDPRSVHEAMCQVLLRYPKRFTVTDPDVRSSIKKFKAVHHATYLYGAQKDPRHPWPSEWTMDLLKHNMREILIPSKTKFAKCIKEYEQSHGFFSDGACFLPQECKFDEDYNLVSEPVTTRVTAKKFEYLLKYTKYFEYPWQHTYGYAPNVKVCCTTDRPGHLRDALLSAVPKDYESSRMIAPNTPYLNIIGSRVRQLLVSLTTATGFIAQMPPEDQSLNRERARLGSQAGQRNPYCTLDLSHASDSIAREFFKALCPPEVWPYIALGLESCIYIDGKAYFPALLATSGNKLTPMLQSIFFLTILNTACDIAHVDRDVSCYNDDLICRWEAYDTVLDLLSLCGATVNVKKTFANGLFRESCGGEYCCGVDVTGFYWPRKALKLAGKVEDVTLQTLISMQHKLYHFPCTRTLLEKVIKTIEPEITCSPVSSDCDDMWAGWCTDLISYTTKHLYFHAVTKRLETQGTNAGNDFAQYVEYLTFLKEGPLYASPLDELLHVSSPRRREFREVKESARDYRDAYVR